jgi:uncharacterized protein YukE
MRVAIVGLITALGLISAGAVETEVEKSVCQGDAADEYTCEWQRKLIVAQQAFAATLDEVDQTTTGSITQTDQ